MTECDTRLDGGEVQGSGVTLDFSMPHRYAAQPCSHYCCCGQPRYDEIHFFNGEWVHDPQLQNPSIAIARLIDEVREERSLSGPYSRHISKHSRSHGYNRHISKHSRS